MVGLSSSRAFFKGMIVVVNRQQYIHPLVDGAGVSHHCCVVVVSDVFGGGQSLVRSDVHYGWGDAATGHDVGIVWAASRLVFMRKIMRQSLSRFDVQGRLA